MLRSIAIMSMTLNKNYVLFESRNAKRPLESLRSAEEANIKTHLSRSLWWLGELDHDRVEMRVFLWVLLKLSSCDNSFFFC